MGRAFAFEPSISALAEPGRLYHTLRYLPLGQLYAQLRHRLRDSFKRRRNTPTARAPQYPGCQWQSSRDFLSPAPDLPMPDALHSGSFRFLNQTQELGWPPDWEPPAVSKLWRYNLHYFEWLWALDYPQARRVVQDWINLGSRHQPDSAWEPYPISHRVLNWTAFFWHRHRRQLDADVAFRDCLWRSLFSQIQWLENHLEFHVRGNHLLENAAALSFAGAVFCGPFARRWRLAGERLLRRELPEQMLADGLHFERSPMYHARVTYLLSILMAAGNRELQSLLAPFLEQALSALSMCLHPDEEIALLNDSAFGITCKPACLRAFAGSLGFPTHAATRGTWSLPDAGYFGYRSAAGTYLICDAGPIGPDYLPAHAHGDIFSFELARGPHRLIVDSGVFDYIPSDMRRYCRSTAAHNTLTLDGSDQCEFWHAFRVARRARPYNVIWSPHSNGFRLEGAHDGYRRLPGQPLHHRRFAWHEPGVLLVRDTIEPAAVSAEATSRIHLHPDSEISGLDENTVTVRGPAGSCMIRFAGLGRLDIEDSFFCPEFGKRLANRALAWTTEAANRSGFCLALDSTVERLDMQTGAQVGGRQFSW